ncbi:hypothetical protein BGX23_001619, partial [Mortierella sp. AD031]
MPFPGNNHGLPMLSSHKRPAEDTTHPYSRQPHPHARTSARNASLSSTTGAAGSSSGPRAQAHNRTAADAEGATAVISSSNFETIAALLQFRILEFPKLSASPSRQHYQKLRFQKSMVNQTRILLAAAVLVVEIPKLARLEDRNHRFRITSRLDRMKTFIELTRDLASIHPQVFGGAREFKNYLATPPGQHERLGRTAMLTISMRLLDLDDAIKSRHERLLREKEEEGERVVAWLDQEKQFEDYEDENPEEAPVIYSESEEKEEEEAPLLRAGPATRREYDDRHLNGQSVSFSGTRFFLNTEQGRPSTYGGSYDTAQSDAWSESDRAQLKRQDQQQRLTMLEVDSLRVTAVEQESRIISLERKLKEQTGDKE